MRGESLALQDLPHAGGAGREAVKPVPPHPSPPVTSPGTTPTVRLVVSRVYQAERSWPLHTLMHAL